MADTINVGKNAVDVRKSEKQLPYSKVIVNVASVDDNTVISYEAGDDSGTTMEIDCPWGSQAMANNLLNLVRGYEYQPYTTMTAIVNPAAEMGDAVQSNGVFGGIYQQDAEFGHTFYNDFSAPQDEQLDHEFTFESPIERRLSRQEAHTKSTFQIQHDNISACVTKENGFAVDNSFSWKLLSDHFELNAGTKNVFNCNKDGIQVDGEIRARTGYIGTNSNGFVINDKNIHNGMTAYNDTSSNGVYLGTDGIGLGKANFTVKSDGTLTAKKGVIGSDSSAWNIGAKSIYNGTDSVSSTTQGTYVGIDGIRLYNSETENFTFQKNGTLAIMKGMTSFSDTSHTSGYYIGGDGIALGGGKLKLNKDGTLTAKKGVIGSDSSAWNIGAKSIYNGTDSISSTTQGAYIGIDGVRVYNDAKNSFTFQKNGTLAIMKGMTGISDTTNTSGMYIGNDGIALGGGKIKLEKSGAFTAKDATIEGSGTFSGTITAKSGRIGADSSGNNGFEITTNAIKNGKNSYSDANAGVYLGTSGIGLGAGKFYVTSGGKLYASDVEIEGKVTATSGSFTGEVTATSGSFKGNITCDSITFSTGVTINGSNITDGTITGGKIGDSEIGDSKISGVGGSKVGSGINGGNINGSSIDGNSLKNSTVPKGKTSQNVQNSLDNGDSAKASVESLMAGSVRATMIYTRGVDTETMKFGQNSENVSWKSATIDGTTIKYLGQ